MSNIQPSSDELKWRLCFDSVHGRSMLYSVKLDRSKGAKQALESLRSTYFSNTVAWKRALLQLFHDLIVQDGVISQLSRPDLEGQLEYCKVIFHSLGLDSDLTTAWRLPDLVAERESLFTKHEKFYAVPTVEALNTHDVHVCNLAWQLSIEKLVCVFGVMLLLSVVLGSVVGVSFGDASRGLQTVQTLVGVFTMMQGLVVALV